MAGVNDVVGVIEALAHAFQSDVSADSQFGVAFCLAVHTDEAASPEVECSVGECLCLFARRHSEMADMLGALGKGIAQHSRAGSPGAGSGVGARA